MKKIFYVGILFTGITIASPAQQFTPFENIQTSNQQLIEEAIKEGVFIVHSYYRLQDTVASAYFGWQNQNWFGQSYSLGIRVKEGYYLMDKAIRPWVYDKKFEQYAQSNRLVPVISSSEYKMPVDTSYTALPYNNVTTNVVQAQQHYFVQDSTLFHQKGYPVDNSDGLKNGWQVWLVVDKPMEEDNAQIPTFLIYRLELTFENGEACYEVRDPSTNKHVLGGFYVLPIVTDIGQISFHLLGVLHQIEGRWQVVRLSDSTPSHMEHSLVTEDGLTPIKIEPANTPPTKTRRSRRNNGENSASI